MMNLRRRLTIAIGLVMCAAWLGSCVCLKSAGHPEKQIADAKSPGTAGIVPEILGFDVEKVTYLTLAPDVTVTLRLNNPSKQTAACAVEFEIVDLADDRVLAEFRETADLVPGLNNQTATLPLRLSRMSGLLARARIRDAAGQLTGRASRPFDVTSDIRTNFRYAGETYAQTIAKPKPIPLRGDGADDLNFWDPIPIGVGPEEMLDEFHACFQNVAQVSIEEGRGHTTSWEDGRTTWTKSAYWMKDIFLFSLPHMEHLYREGPRRGIYMMPWCEHKGARQEYFAKDFPWIYHPAPESYYPGCWQMNLDPEYRHKLTPEDERMARFNLHGAESWLEYAAEEIDLVVEKFETRLIWWDNSYGGAHIPYTLDMLRDMHADRRPATPPPAVMVNGEAGYHSDIYWIEWGMPERMQDYVRLMHNIVAERPQVKNGPATISFGQVHPGSRTGQQEAITDPANVYNDPRYTHIYRQLLFECVASEARLVYQQQWPRNCLEWRIKHFRDTFRDHAKTWGFLTMFEHVFNSRDVAPYPLAESVRVTDVPAAYGDEIEDGKVHVVARSPISQPDVIYLHVFNYTGTTADTSKARPRPTPLDKVTIRMDTPGFARDYTVRAFSPDFAEYDDAVTPERTHQSNHLEFSVPVDTYTLVIVKRRWV